MLKTHLEISRKVLRVLLDHGHQAYLVGGFVRDFLLEINSDDIDITTSATPDEVMSLFSKTKPTGVKYGTVTVYMDDIPFEVTTFRQEGVYLNNRHPEEVRFSHDLMEDVQRRDFTINALAMDIHGEIIDYFNGLTDIKNGIVRAIGNPYERFQEDALRILRTFRFVSKCNFDIEKETMESIQTHHALLKNIANERIIQEFVKIAGYPHHQKAYQAILDSQVLKSLPELERGIQFLASHDAGMLSSLTFFTVCFYLNDQTIPDSWRFSNKQRAIMNKVIELVEVTQNDEFSGLAIYSLGLEICLLANEVNRLLNPANDQKQFIKTFYESLPIHKTCDLAFKGQDILALTDLKNAFKIGDIIDDLVYQVITRQINNDYEELKKYTFDKYFNG